MKLDTSSLCGTITFRRDFFACAVVLAPDEAALEDGASASYRFRTIGSIILHFSVDVVDVVGGGGGDGTRFGVSLGGFIPTCLVTSGDGRKTIQMLVLPRATG